MNKKRPKLAIYLEQFGIAPSHFARRISRSPSTVTRICSGETMPDPATGWLIVKACDGWIAFEELYTSAKQHWSSVGECPTPAVAVPGWTPHLRAPGARSLARLGRPRGAFQTFDQAIWAHSAGSAIIMAWAALEALFRPGRTQITKNLAACIATFLNPPGPQRDWAYHAVARLYEARGKTAHYAQIPEGEQLLDSFGLARRSFAKCFEARELPDAGILMRRWKNLE
jgi:hypothetical protein